MKSSCLVALILMTVLMVYAADPAGTWKGTAETPMGPMETTIVLQVAGTSLNGTVKTDMFESKIEKGTIDGDKVSFEINMDFGTLTYAGTVAGDELKLNVNGPDGSPSPLNCKRQK